MDWLSNLNIEGFLVGLFAFLLIGVFHPIVTKLQRNFGKKVWPFLLVPGVIAAFISVFIAHSLISVGLGVLAFALFWSTIEIFKQEKRVRERG
jgi:Flp pilus assembly pilin Flp